MRPVVTPSEMRAVDTAASHPTEVLVQRAGAAVARVAVRMMGGTYGRTVVVVAGKGHNGADGRVAASILRDAGVRIIEVDAASPPHALPAADLVIDAGYGTGFRGTWPAPSTSSPVLAVDIPSGVDAATGAAPGPVMRATRTVTFQALKPGLLVPPGRELAGVVEVADIGLGMGVAAVAHAHAVDRDDVTSWLPPRAVDAHKWRSAVRVVAGSTRSVGASPAAPAAVAEATSIAARNGPCHALRARIAPFRPASAARLRTAT